MYEKISRLLWKDSVKIPFKKNNQSHETNPLFIYYDNFSALGN